ncbi:DUF1049 domain-containing protein [Hippea alviniae]|uniref:DUF1049 domain-containing protein n=1 Tax=Hippea alviniae TaxID=1279027 RepID=UPI00047ACEF7|nr:DUF1049 domain-containing protein [Hippea alviniae]
MLEILQKSFVNTISIVETIVLIVIVVFIVGLWVYVPFGIMSINRRLKRLEKEIKRSREEN